VANSRSARKRIRANERKHVRNRAVRSAVRTKIAKARRELVSFVSAEDATEEVRTAISALDRAAEKGVLHPRNAARRKSRLALMANKLARAATAGADEESVRAAALGGEKGRAARGRGRAAAASPSAVKTATKKAPAAGTGRAAPKASAKTAAKSTFATKSSARKKS
jgi:small subunit ribosomal protein S20